MNLEDGANSARSSVGANRPLRITYFEGFQFSISFMADHSLVRDALPKTFGRTTINFSRDSKIAERSCARFIVELAASQNLGSSQCDQVPVVVFGNMLPGPLPKQSVGLRRPR
jgi:hypothetical protein